MNPNDQMPTETEGNPPFSTFLAKKHGVEEVAELNKVILTLRTRLAEVTETANFFERGMHGAQENEKMLKETVAEVTKERDAMKTLLEKISEPHLYNPGHSIRAARKLLSTLPRCYSEEEVRPAMEALERIKRTHPNDESLRDSICNSALSTLRAEPQKVQRSTIPPPSS